MRSTRDSTTDGIISISNLTSTISSPVLQGALTEGIAGGVTGFTLSSAARILNGENVLDAFNAAAGDAALSFSISSVSGGVSGYRNAQAMGKNGWTGKEVAAKTTTSQYSLNPDPNGNNVTLYRGTTGSEGKPGSLFMTNDPEYAAIYVKNGGNVVKVTIPKYTLDKMYYDGNLKYYRGSYNGGSKNYLEYEFRSNIKTQIVPLFK